MRYLVKGDCGIGCIDPDRQVAALRRRARRLWVRRVIACLCLLLMGFFAVQLFRANESAEQVVVGPSLEWDSPASVISWLRWQLSGIGSQVRNGIQDALPFGNLSVIFKMAFCAVAAAVFLRGPQRS